MTKAQAFRRAQLTRMYGNDGRVTNNPVAKSQDTRSHAAQFSHPFFWAPFILIGNGL
ncbi:hypothetical protein [Stenomitos frigidus]|uniref:hypothetical protein n=1 Tax=Stenomitos frigidus TaxID=1886765 RepID=UPI0015E6CDD7|nr:hypothetical protein [Stenomitos frigidus]